MTAVYINSPIAMSYLKTPSAGITGFENPCTPYLKDSLNLDDLFVHSKHSMRLVESPLTSFSLGIEVNDWLLLDAALVPLPSDVVLFEVNNEYCIAIWSEVYRLAQINPVHFNEVNVLGVITISVHHFRKPPKLPFNENLCDINFHQLLVEREYATIFCRASGLSMLPYIHDKDILVLERHLDVNEGDVAIVAFNNDLVVKRVGLQERQLYSDNNQFKPITVNKSDYLKLHGVVRYSLRLHRSLN